MANALKSFQFDAGTEGLLLHQALHGYAEGHRLLESSIPIPDDLKRLMLRMSDLSGTGVVNGFQDYLTGYPLPSLDAYALAKTWYAPEMPRPGCVWTHTFIIPASVMARIPSLSAIRPQFKRPSGQSISDSYSTPVVLDSGWRAVDSPSDLNQMTEMQAMLSSHYQKEWRPLIISARDSDEFAELIFAAWSQKWPSLRMSFTFCTGSLSARTVEKRPLDVQCVPISIVRQVSREIAADGLSEPIVMSVAPLDLPRWTLLAANDALQCDGGPVRNFLWSVADIESSRTDFASFIRVYDTLGKPSPLSETVDLIAGLFPRATDGRLLKMAVFGDQTRYLVPGAGPKDVFLALGTTDHYQSFDSDELSIRQRASRLLAEQPTDGFLLVEQLFRAPLNSLGDEILTSLILAMKPEDALKFATNQPQFLPALFRANPSLASSPQLWLAARDRKRELFESLAARQDMDSTLVAGIISALLDSGSEVFIRRSVERWGKPAVFQVLDWTEAHQGNMSETCRQALTFQVPDVMNWVEAEPKRSTQSLVAVARVVAPYAHQLSDHDSTVWLQTFRILQDRHQEEEATYVCTFLLALAFCNAPPSSLDLLSESFERVHEAVRIGRLSDREWIIVEPLVPHLSWLRDWDKCERLRRGLILAFLSNQWPAAELIRRIVDRDLIRQILKSAEDVDGGEEFSRGVA